MKTTTQLTIALAATSVLIAGCDTMNTAREHHASSLYAYLYPNRDNHIETPAIPVLSLPLHVGVAFVPENDRPRERSFGCAFDQVTISESQKIALMKEISKQFKKYPFIQSIDLIPTMYLTSGGSFANLDQIRSMYGVDVMALISYDQVQFSGEGLLSLTYWTVAGAVVVPGEKNETKTMVDTAVFDIASRKMLFRAPGVGDVKDAATLMTLDEQLHQNSERGFTKAAADLTTNLQVALVEFQERVTNSLAQAKEMGTNGPPAEYKINYKPGYTGSGAFNGTETCLLAGVGGCFLWTLRNSRKNKA